MVLHRAVADEAALEIPQPVSPAQPGLGGAGLSPEQGPDGKTEPLGQGLGDESGLVESTSQESEPGERDRRDDVTPLTDLRRKALRQDLAQVPGQELQVPKLERVDHVGQRRLVAVERHQPVPGRRVSQTLSADLAAPRREVAAAPTTAAGGLTRELAPTSSAEPEELTTPSQGRAASETREGEQGFEHRGQGPKETVSKGHAYTRSKDPRPGEGGGGPSAGSREWNGIGDGILAVPSPAERTVGANRYEREGDEVRRTKILMAALSIAVLVGVSPASGVEAYVYTLGVTGGVGGSLDIDPDAGLDHPSLQLSLGVVQQPRTQLVVRVGHLDLDPEGGFAPMGGGSLTYANISGEYRLVRPLYDSGLYLGLGAYRFEGEEDAAFDDTAVGGVFGVTGEFDLTRRWAVLVDLSVHYADLDVAEVFGMANAGIAFRF